MVGIAFGTDPTKQRIGDVLLSASVQLYEPRKVEESKTIYRGPQVEAGPLLLNRFKNVTGWSHGLNDGESARLIACTLLSGEAVIDRKGYRDALLAEFPAAKGGEMEGAGLYAAAANRGLEWILAKGICDYADGNKGVDKAARQRTAAAAAVSLAETVLSDSTAFVDLGLRPICDPEITLEPLSDSERLAALFEIYTDTSEPYYLVRSIDRALERRMRGVSFWFYGPSGTGKTCAIQRQLVLRKSPYLYVDLGLYTEADTRQLLRAIHQEVLEQLGDTAIVPSDLEPEAISHALLNDLNTRFQGRAIHLHVDEIPLDGTDGFSEFVKRICALSIASPKYAPDIDLRLLLSSIANPTPCIGAFQKKVSQRLDFVRIDPWPNEEIRALVQLLVPELGLELDASDVDDLVGFANGRPRRVKRFLSRAADQLPSGLASFPDLLAESRREDLG